MQVVIPDFVSVVELETAPFRNAREADDWAVSHGIIGLMSDAVLYGCVSIGGIPYRAKTTLKQHRDQNQPTKAYSYEISNIEVLSGTARIVILPNDKASMDVKILLNNVVDVNGVPLLDRLRHKS